MLHWLSIDMCASCLCVLCWNEQAKSQTSRPCLALRQANWRTLKHRRRPSIALRTMSFVTSAVVGHNCHCQFQFRDFHSRPVQRCRIFRHTGGKARVVGKPSTGEASQFGGRGQVVADHRVLPIAPGLAGKNFWSAPHIAQIESAAP